MTRTKFTYGFLILALGMMVTDCYRLLRAPVDTAFAATSGVQHARRF
jgi:hypothetical protein